MELLVVVITVGIDTLSSTPGSKNMSTHNGFVVRNVLVMCIIWFTKAKLSVFV